MRLAWRSIVGFVPTALIMSCLLLMGALFAGAAWWLGELEFARFPSAQELRAQVESQELVILDRFGRVLEETSTGHSGSRLAWVELARISPEVVEQVVALEDRRFYRHHGVDPLAVLRASRDLLLRRGSQSATISMQTVHLLAGPRGTEDTWLRDLLGAVRALALEFQWTKEEILEAYLNLVPFRSDLVGVNAAARGLFAKEVHALDARESLLLAALLRAPRAEPKPVARRGCWLMEQRGLGPQVLSESQQSRGAQISACKVFFDFALKALSKPIEPDLRIRQAQAFAQRLEAETALATRKAASNGEAPLPSTRLLGGSAINRLQQPTQKDLRPEVQSLLAKPLRTPIDRDLQVWVREQLEARLAKLSDRNIAHAAALVLDNRSGDVVAYVDAGTRQSERETDFVNQRRSAGSLLLPFLFATAFDRRLITASTVFPTRDSLTAPRSLSVSQALDSAAPAAAIQVLKMVGVEAYLERLRNLGFTQTLAAESYGDSLALGAFDASLWELVNAYRALANQGLFSMPKLLLDPYESRLLQGNLETASQPERSVFAPGSTFTLAEILAARAKAWGPGLAPEYWVAVKPGQGAELRDFWTIGFSSRYTVGVWFGARAEVPVWKVAPEESSAPVWLALMNRLHRREGTPEPEPLGLLPVLPQPEAISGEVKDEAKLQAAAPARESLPRPKIVFPQANAELALTQQSQPTIVFRAQDASSHEQWFFNGERLGAAHEPRLWRARRGRHWLAIRDREGRIVDEVRFLVR